MEKNSQKVEVLISCMNQRDHSIIERSNIQSDVIVVNQCDVEDVTKFSFTNRKGELCKATFISTMERGLSKSRNMALRYAQGDICIICDDDEYFVDDYVEKIKDIFQRNSTYSIIASKFIIPGNYYMKKTFWDMPKTITYKNALKISSWQLAFKRKDIIEKNIHFDEKIGSGISKAGGEEKIFLHDCLKSGLTGQYVPIILGKINYEDSQWANNIFSYEYFIDWGYYTRRLKGGRLAATIMSMVFALKKYKEYNNKCSLPKALYGMLLGVYVKK